MDIILQSWGGGCYLVNKILFALAQNKTPSIKRKIMLVAWSVYLLGVPAWVIILVHNSHWIAASVEFAGVPAMLLGLYNVYSNFRKPNRMFTRVVTLITYAAIVIGISYSVIDHGGLYALTQFLELAVTIGFLLGSYLLAKNNPMGWLCFMLMNISMAMLMYLQEKEILMVQQLLSLIFVCYGCYSAWRIQYVK